LPIRLMAMPAVGELLSRLVPPSPKSVLRFAGFMGEKATLATHPELVDLMVATGRDPITAASARSEMRALVSPFALLSPSGFRRHSQVRRDQLRQLAMPTLMVWGEHGFAELTGLVTIEDFVEFTKWSRKEHDMRGFEPHDLVGQGDITVKDIAPYIYPSDEEIARCGLRGIYLSNFFPWNAKDQYETMHKEWNFLGVSYERERTFNLFSKIEDHANDVHDYLKYLKFGYGRATDDASMEIRHGRMSREEGIEMVRRYDAREPSTLASYCDFLEISPKRFYEIVEPMRDPKIWEKANGAWTPLDSVICHPIRQQEEAVRVDPSSDRTLAPHNRDLFYNPANPPEKKGNPDMDLPSRAFRVI